MNQPINEQVTAAKSTGTGKKIAKTLNDFCYGEWDRVDAKAQKKSPWFWVIVGVALVLAAMIFN
jgi:hypothetical protein